MPAPVEDELNVLVESLRASEYTKDDSILILKEYINVLIQNNLESNQRYGVGMTTADFTKRVKKHDWKFAHGFYGNWAKHAIDQKDQDVGC